LRRVARSPILQQDLNLGASFFTMDLSLTSHATSLIGSNTSLLTNRTNDNDGHSDVNTTDSSIDFGHSLGSNNTSLDNDSSYSAEEQVIRQRGRRMPKKKILQELHQIGQSQQENLGKLISSRDLFLKVKQNSMCSPESKSKNSQSSPDHKLIQNHALVARLRNESCKRKSLLRTPVKRRLRRNVDILSQVRKSDKRRRGS